MFSRTLLLCRLMAECFVLVICCARSTYGAQFNTNISEYANLWEICSLRAEVTWILLLEKGKTIFKSIKDTVKDEQKEMSLHCHKVKKKEDLTVLILKIRYHRVLQASLEISKNQRESRVLLTHQDKGLGIYSYDTTLVK